MTTHAKRVDAMQEALHRSFAILRRAGACLAIAAFASCGGSDGAVPPAETVGSVTTAAISSTHTGATYPLQIYLPASYASGMQYYPVIYATDGDAAYPPEGRFENFKEILQRRGVDAILVGIGGTARRNIDFLLPGAVDYHAFLTSELIPFIESKFRADPKRRLLSGISFGGSFVVTSLFLEAPTGLFFSHYLSAEGSFQQPSFIAQSQQFSATIGSASVPATLILARGFVSPSTNSAVVDDFYRQMLARNYTGLSLVETSFATDHVGTDNPSFEDAMARIFK